MLQNCPICCIDSHSEGIRLFKNTACPLTCCESAIHLQGLAVNFDNGAVAENDKRDSGTDGTNRRASLVALAVVIVLFVVGWLVTRELYSNSKD
jgi:hypothetical protein